MKLNLNSELQLLRKLCKMLLKQGVNLLIHDDLKNKDQISFNLSNFEYDLEMENVNKQIQIHTDIEKLYFQSNAIILLNSAEFKVIIFF